MYKQPVIVSINFFYSLTKTVQICTTNFKIYNSKTLTVSRQLWSAVEVKILFKISALCGEYISKRIYKYVDVYINTGTNL